MKKMGLENLGGQVLYHLESSGITTLPIQEQVIDVCFSNKSISEETEAKFLQIINELNAFPNNKEIMLAKECVQLKLKELFPKKSKEAFSPVIQEIISSFPQADAEKIYRCISEDIFGAMDKDEQKLNILLKVVRKELQSPYPAGSCTKSHQGVFFLTVCEETTYQSIAIQTVLRLNFDEKRSPEFKKEHGRVSVNETEFVIEPTRRKGTLAYFVSKNSEKLFSELASIEIRNSERAVQLISIKYKN